VKVTGEIFSFQKKREKELKRQDTKSIETFRPKDRYWTELWRALYQKAPKGQFLIFRKTIQSLLKEVFSKYIRKNLSGKRTE